MWLVSCADLINSRVSLTPIRLSNAFERRFGVAPRLFRDMHRTAGPDPNHRD